APGFIRRRSRKKLYGPSRSIGASPSRRTRTRCTNRWSSASSAHALAKGRLKARQGVAERHSSPSFEIIYFVGDGLHGAQRRRRRLISTYHISRSNMLHILAGFFSVQTFCAPSLFTIFFRSTCHSIFGQTNLAVTPDAWTTSSDWADAPSWL